MFRLKLNDLFADFTEAARTAEFGQTSDVKLPMLTGQILDELCREVTPLIRADQPMCAVTSPCVIIGDLHGHLFDLFRIYIKYGPPEHFQYVFLGDYIDRGEFQLETIVFLLLLKLHYPHNVVLIRGNHETCFFKAKTSFALEFQKAHISLDVYKFFINIFNELPPACLLDGVNFCAHGGIGPNVTLQSLRGIIYPIHNSAIFDELMWSDPSDKTKTFGPSPRGTGYIFGEESVTNFLNTNDFKRIIRSHSVLQDGFQEFFDGKVLSIFSASNYMGRNENKSAVLYFSSPDNYRFDVFPPMPYITRNEIQIKADEKDNVEKSKKEISNKRIKHYSTDPMLSMNKAGFPLNRAGRPILNLPNFTSFKPCSQKQGINK